MTVFDHLNQPAIDDELQKFDHDGFLRLEHLTKSYAEGGKKRLVLNDATLELRKGEIVAVLGKSGSGKTTLLNLMGGIDRVDSGEIALAGLKLTSMKDRQWTIFRRANIGFIFQFFNLIPTLTVRENVVLPLELNGLLDENGKMRAGELLAEVGLADRHKSFPDQLSGGEQQRVAIARALVHDPALVLADEPTGNLDDETGRQVLALIERLTRKNGKTLVLVTHSNEAAAIADRIFNLQHGSLVEQLR
jgi:putative ABC transport system ATP-binding protein